MVLRSRRYGIYTLALFALVNFLNYGNRNILFAMYDDLRESFGFSNADLGLLGSVFMVSHAVGTPIVGWAGDRFDRRRIIALGVLIWSMAAAATAMASSFAGIAISRALVGFATAVCVPVTLSLLCDVFPKERKARTTAIFNLGLFLGGAAAFGLGDVVGYPMAIWLLVVPGLVLAGLVAQLDVPGRSTGPSIGMATYLRHAGELMRVPTLRWVMVGTTFMAFSSGGWLSWFYDFLLTKGMSQDTALALFGAGLFGGLLGVLSGGSVGDWLQLRRSYGRLAAVSLGMTMTVPVALAATFLDPGIGLYVTTWLTLYFATWYHGPVAAVVDDLARNDRSATAQALVIFVMHLLGTAPSSWAVGIVADRYGLTVAMLLPTAAVAIAAVVFLGGFRTVAADRIAAHESPEVSCAG